MSDQTGSPAAAAGELATADQTCAAADDPGWWDPQPGETPEAWATRIETAVEDSIAWPTAPGAGHMWALANAYAAADRASQQARRRRSPGHTRGGRGR